MKYEVRKEVICKNGKYKIVGNRIIADIRFEMSAYGGSTNGKELLDHLVYEGVLGDLIKKGYVDLCTGTHVRLVGFSFGDEKTDTQR